MSTRRCHRPLALCQVEDPNLSRIRKLLYSDIDISSSCQEIRQNTNQERPRFGSLIACRWRHRSASLSPGSNSARRS